MTSAESREARVLFVVDNDFGALGTVMYFLGGQALASRATILLPARAHALHAGGLGVASRPYKNLRDILDVVEGERFDVAFLFSGYLLAAQRILRISELGALVRALRSSGCRVATSDPYLGTFRDLPNAAHPPGNGPMRLAFLRARTWLHVRRVERILAGVTHIYPVGVEGMPAGPRRISFFNPPYVRSREARADPLRWIFVLARFDLEYQEKTHGLQGFARQVEGKVREALASGRQATVVAPAALVEALAPRFAAERGVELVAECPFHEFERRVFEAEVAFYWQMFSTSAILRSWSGLPVFFFDAGHGARLVGPLHAAGLRYYYMGAQPAMLDIGDRLDAARLECAANGVRDAARERLARLARHTPANEVAGIV